MFYNKNAYFALYNINAKKNGEYIIGIQEMFNKF